MSMKDQVDAHAAASPAPAGPQSYSERRLLEIAQSTAQIAFWVRLWSILSVAGVVLWFLIMLLSHR